MSRYPDERRLAPILYQQQAQDRADRMQVWESGIAKLDESIAEAENSGFADPDLSLSPFESFLASLPSILFLTLAIQEGRVIIEVEADLIV
jgi:hypothetical protein